MKKIILPFMSLFFISCGGGGGGGGSVTNLANSDKVTVTDSDKTVLLNDDFSKYQWHIEDLGSNLSSTGNDYYNRSNHTTVGGNDMGLKEIYTDKTNYGYLGYNSGNPIRIQVVDDGIDANHEDLKDNMNLSSSYNDYTNTYGDPTSQNSSASHGTQVAGLIGAVGYNNIGVKGVAPSSNLVGYTLQSSGSSLTTTSSSLERAWLTGTNADSIAVSNNSWGSCVDKDLSNNESFLQSGANLLRGNKGRIYVFSAGNGRGGSEGCPNTSNMESANTSYINNSQYAISVAAVGNNNQVTGYSSPGSNVLVSGYSGDLSNSQVAMGTTVPTNSNQGTNWDGSKYGNNNTWSADTKGNYTYTFQGTSASAPVVSGAIALVLEACPNLTYRDVKYLIATTSTQIATNAVTNNAGLKHSNDTGYGLINVKGMIDACKAPTYTLLPARQTSTGSEGTTTAIAGTTTVTKTINIGANLDVEWVGLTISTNYSSLQNLEIKLKSPAGTESVLLHANNGLGNSGTVNGAIVRGYFTSGFRLSSVAFVNESSNGNWEVSVTSNNGSGTGNITNVSLEVVGH